MTNDQRLPSSSVFPIQVLDKTCKALSDLDVAAGELRLFGGSHVPALASDLQMSPGFIRGSASHAEIVRKVAVGPLTEAFRDVGRDSS